MPLNIDFDTYLFLIVLIVLSLIIFNIWFIVRKIKEYRKNNTRFRLRFRHFTHYIVPFNLLTILGVIFLGYLIYIQPTPRIEYSSPQTEGTWESYDKPIEVVFNMPVSMERLVPNMNPLMKGTWVWEPYLGIEMLTRVGKFYPTETLFPNERIVVYITGIGRAGFHDESHEGGIVLQSVVLPEVKATTPFHKSDNVDIENEIKLMFTKPIETLADISIKISPEIKFQIENLSPTLLKIVPETKLSQSTKYAISIERTPKRIELQSNQTLERDNSELIHRIEFTTVKEPFIKSITPKGSGTRPESKIRFRFEAEMDKDSVLNNLSIEPAILGEYTWQDGRTLLFTPNKPLEKETKYSVKINSGLRSIYGGISDKEITHEFETVGKVKATEFVPHNGESRVGVDSNIIITFDQEVDQKSAQDRFSISPNITGQFSWDGNKLIFDPLTLSFGTTYTVRIAPGVKSIYGIDSDSEISFSFTTRTNQIVISMPLYYQPQYPVSFSCNIYAAKMALAWKGYNTDISGLISEIGSDARQDSYGRWIGNPYVNFIGNGDGSWGYGTYWTALQKVFNNRGIATEVRTKWNLNELARSIENGHPVIIWRYNGTSQDRNLEWGSPGVYAINGQHGGVVTGFRGTIDNPTHFYLNDPWFGLIWMDRYTFDYYWSRLNRSALIIY